MKTLVIASIVAAFACVSAVQAGENKDQGCAGKSSCCAEKSACAAQAKADLAKARAAASEKGAYQLVKR
jgi:hypothetical protein